MRMLSLLVTLLALQSNLAWAADDAELALTADAPNGEVNQQSESSNGGGVILDGRYIAPPYNIIAVAEGVELNGHFVPEARFNGRSRRRRDDPKQVEFAARIRNRLDDGAWLLGWKEGEYGMLSDSRMSDIVYTLSSESSGNEKIDELEEVGAPWIERADWRQLVERCDLPASVLDQCGASFDMASNVDPELLASIRVPQRRL